MMRARMYRPVVACCLTGVKRRSLPLIAVAMLCGCQSAPFVAPAIDLP